MTLIQGCALFVAAMLAGALNSIAGGGSFISFPTLLFTGVPTKLANATNTVALWPASLAGAVAYRKDLDTKNRLQLWVFLGVSLAGGLLGALLLLNISSKTFAHLVPYLLLVATLIFTFGGSIAARIRAAREGSSDAALEAKGQGPAPLTLIVSALMQFVTAIYGGFFGGGIGIIMLATLSILGMENIHGMNALKNILATCINGIAVVAFVIARMVLWPQALLMIVGGVVGGYASGYFARRLDPKLVRRIVVIFAWCLTAYFFAFRG
ncbi:MAG TPA: sulfite exporter TauE/SafE family protein [Ktedonobacterales bacterium]